MRKVKKLSKKAQAARDAKEVVRRNKAVARAFEDMNHVLSRFNSEEHGARWLMKGRTLNLLFSAQYGAILALIDPTSGHSGKELIADYKNKKWKVR